MAEFAAQGRPAGSRAGAQGKGRATVRAPLRRDGRTSKPGAHQMMQLVS